MTGSTQAMEIGLVLQGGGALGAYEYGGITGLFDLIDEAVKEGRDITLKVVTGVSIGAINAACVVGPPIARMHGGGCPICGTT
ncbi:MAG: patatin-like phospholipase family protein [Xanthobacteraceae bacterium]